MERVNAIFRHPLYQAQYQALQQAESDRVFCRHTLEHFLDVARLMWIWNLENESGLEKSVVYAAALLHDIGRYAQICLDIPHHEASAELAEKILPACGYSPEETGQITAAVLTHRNQAEITKRLGEYLYRADKLSRCCFSCKAAAECNWSMEKRNLELKF